MFNCSKKEQEEKDATFENRIIYSLPVRLGAWFEELSLQDEKNKITAYKKDHCQLLIQKTKKMFRNLMKPTTLALEPNYVVYGHNYQIKTSDILGTINQGSETACDMKYVVLLNRKKGLYLSGLISDQEIESSQHFRHGCSLTASRIRECYVRNTFKIISCTGQEDGEKVPCGVDVLIQICESGESVPLYLHCENPTTGLAKIIHKECVDVIVYCDTVGEHLSLYLSRSPDIYSRFKFLNWDPNKRGETAGTNFAPNSRIIIQHTASGRNLTVEPNLWIPTFFGPEAKVSCHTYRDTHKMETAENFWMLISRPESDMNLFVRAATGESGIPHELFE